MGPADEERTYKGVHAQERYDKMLEFADDNDLRVTKLADAGQIYLDNSGNLSTVPEGNVYVKVTGYDNEGLTNMWNYVNTH